MKRILQELMKSLWVCLVLAVFIVLSPANIEAAGSTQAVKAQWGLVVKMNQEQLRFAQRNVADLTASMQSLGVASGVRDGKLELSGTHDLEELRAILFDAAAKWIDFLGGPVELTLALPAGDTPVTLQMQARMTTGYRWDVLPVASARYVQSGKPTFAPRHRGYGAPHIQTIQLQSREAGDSAVFLFYRRPFQKGAPVKTRLNISVTDAVDLIRLSDPTPSEPQSKRSTAAAFDPFRGLEAKALPASWDWRVQNPGMIPAVRDQDGCGSCWAFGTVGVMESALKKGGGTLTDLSEQFLVSCNNDDWNCANGGLTAHMYHYDTLGKSQTVVGAVLESVKPYTATNGTCTDTYNHPYKLSDWQFVTGSEWTVPTNDQLKNAIYTYGPITAGVCVDDGWYDYSGGVYVTNANVCGGSTNHQIILVGWNDSSQSWILRNSWGSEWGESGNMRIKYDPAGSTSRVGEGTSWVTYTNPSKPAGISSVLPLLLGD